MTVASMKLLTALTFALLMSVIAQIGLTASVMTQQKHTAEQVQKINDDYTPMFVVEAIVESNNLMTQEIVGIREGDAVEVRVVQKKYADFQKMIIQNMSHTRSLTTE